MRLRKSVFWPAFLLLSLALSSAAIDSEGFLRVVTALNHWFLDRLSGVYAWAVLGIFLVAIVAFVSPLGKIRIGGPNAKRLLSPVSWCSVTLCTMTAVGILFWAVAEPLYHFTAPPSSLGIVPKSPEAARFALSTLYLHWSLLPCAVYAVPALMFALMFYNRKAPFTLASSWRPLLGKYADGRFASAIDAISLYSLVAGMAASLATGVLTLSGGLERYGLPSNRTTWIGVGIVIVIAFLASAIAGLERGIKVLSNINSLFFVGLAFFVVAFGPWREMFALSGLANADYFSQFVGRALFLGFDKADSWPRSWTVFYWAVWLAWAPVSSIFLGRIGVGYTVRTFLTVNLLLPASFSILWMSIFGGSALVLEMQGAGFSDVLAKLGPEAAVYALFAEFPFSNWIIPAFLVTAFISYVTSADSSTLVMAGMSTCGISTENSEPPTYMKILWGSMVGGLALVMLCLSGLEGIRTLCYLGGVPALFYEIGVAISLLTACCQPAKYDLSAEENLDKVLEPVSATS